MGVRGRGHGGRRGGGWPERLLGNGLPDADLARGLRAVGELQETPALWKRRTGSVSRFPRVCIFCTFLLECAPVIRRAY